MNKALPAWKVALVIVATAMITSGVRMQGCKLPGWPSIVAPKVTAVTYVHDEKAAIPSGVMSALNELNATGIVATAFPDDASDGDDQVPDQYKVTLPAAKTVGIPCLVVQAGERVLRTVKSPMTKQEVLGAAK